MFISAIRLTEYSRSQICQFILCQKVFKHVETQRVTPPSSPSIHRHQMDSNQLNETSLVDVQVVVDENTDELMDSDLVDVQLVDAENPHELMDTQLIKQNVTVIQGKSHVIHLI